MPKYNDLIFSGILREKLYFHLPKCPNGKQPQFEHKQRICDFSIMDTDMGATSRMQSSLCPLPPVPAVRKHYAELHKLEVTVSRKIKNPTKFSAEISNTTWATQFDQPKLIMTDVIFYSVIGRHSRKIHKPNNLENYTTLFRPKIPNYKRSADITEKRRIPNQPLTGR